MSTLKQIVSNTSILAISNIIARAASFVSVIIMTTNLSLFEYGILTLALALSGPILTLCNLGFDELITADVARYLGEKKYDYAKKLLISYFSFQWLMLPIIGFGVYLLRPFLQEQYGELLYNHVYVLLYYVALQLARTGINTFLNIHSGFLGIAKAQVAEPIIRCLFLFGLIGINHVTVEYVLWSYVIGSMASIMVALPAVYRTILPYLSYATTKRNMLWLVIRSHGKWQGVIQVITSAINSLRYHFINVIISTEAVALYSVAQSMYSVLTSLLPIKTVIAPLIAHRIADKANMRSFIEKASKYTLATYILAMTGALIAAPLVIAFFFPKYVAAIILFEIMVLRLPLNMFSVIQVPLMVANKEQKFMSMVATVNLCLMAIFTPLFLYTFGIMGTILEWLVTAIIIVILREKHLRRKYRIKTFSWKAFLSFDATDVQVLRELWAITKKILAKLGLRSRSAV